MNANSAIRVLLVDDNVSFLAVLTSFLLTAPQLEVVGQAFSGEEGLVQAVRLQPDLILLDLSLPDISGLEVARRLGTQLNAPKIIILTLHNSHEYRLAAQAAGAADFVLKEEVAVRLLASIDDLFQILTCPESIAPIDSDSI